MTNRRWINTRVVSVWNGLRYVERSVEGYWYDGPLALAHNTPDRNEIHFKFWEANATTQVAAVDTSPTLLVDTDYVLQVEIENNGDETPASTTYGFQYNLASAGWVDVTASSTVVQTANPTGLSNGTATVVGDNLGSALLFLAGEECTDGITAGYALASSDTTPEYTIFKFGFTIVSTEVTNGQTLLFRTILDAAGTPTVLETYGAAPTGISTTVSEGGGGGIEILRRRIEG